MIFEEALKALMEGKKIHHPTFNKDEYLMACYVTINPILCPEGRESFDIVKERGMSITWMLGDHVHPKMRPKFPPSCNDPIHNCPQLNLLLLMADDWEILE